MIISSVICSANALLQLKISRLRRMLKVKCILSFVFLARYRPPSATYVLKFISVQF